MKKRFIIIAIALLMVVNLSALTTISYHRFVSNNEDGSTCKISGDDYLNQALSLSPSQTQQLKAINQSFQIRADTISMQLFTTRTELVALLKAPDPDKNRINDVLLEIGSLQTDLQRQVIESVLKQKAILNQEQQEKFFTIIGDRLIHEARCKQANTLNSLNNNCNQNCN